jgi:hypothetical protein
MIHPFVRKLSSNENMKHKGSCHCGAVSFEVEAPEKLQLTECNCSICSRSGFLHLIVNKDKFKLLSGDDNLKTYSFDTGEAKHYFCKTCGIKSFYIPRSHPDGYSVNARCLDDATINSMSITPFDGKNWEDNIEKLRKQREV